MNLLQRGGTHHKGGSHIHSPVLLQEVIEYLVTPFLHSNLNPKQERIYVDCTVGEGGHAEAILERDRNALLIGIDIDPSQIEKARANLEKFGDRVILINENFAAMEKVMWETGMERNSITGFLYDLGMSMAHIVSGRGFSFEDESLDMRYSPDSREKASDIVNSCSEKELFRIILNYGYGNRDSRSLKEARKIARAIVRYRNSKGKIKTARELAQIVSKAVPPKPFARKHPATRVFQALRIAVNRELDNFKISFSEAIDYLKPGGRIAVITFHSLERRAVKEMKRKFSQIVKLITPKGVRPSEEEIKRNPRSRSAVLYVFEKI